MTSRYKVYRYRRIMVVCISVLVLYGCGVPDHGGSPAVQSNADSPGATNTPFITPSIQADGLTPPLNEPLATVPTATPADRSPQLLHLALYTPDPLPITSQDGYFMIGESRYGLYLRDDTQDGVYMIFMTADGLKTHNDGDRIVYMSGYGRILRDFGTLNKTTLKGQEQFQSRKTNIVMGFATLAGTVKNADAQSQVAAAHTTMQASIASDVWETPAMLKESAFKGVFATDRESIQVLLDIPAKDLSDDEQATARWIIDQTVKIDELLVRQMLELNTKPITNPQEWQDAWDTLYEGTAAYHHADYLGALNLYEQAWELAMQATQ